jgi:hypothetical protein
VTKRGRSSRHHTDSPPPLEQVAAHAGRLEACGLFAPCPQRRAAIVAHAVGALDEEEQTARHISGCLACAGALDTLSRELGSSLESAGPPTRRLGRRRLGTRSRGVTADPARSPSAVATAGMAARVAGVNGCQLAVWRYVESHHGFAARRRWLAGALLVAFVALVLVLHVATSSTAISPHRVTIATGAVASRGSAASPRHSAPTAAAAGQPGVAVVRPHIHKSAPPRRRLSTRPRRVRRRSRPPAMTAVPASTEPARAPVTSAPVPPARTSPTATPPEAVRQPIPAAPSNNQWAGDFSP